MTLAETLKLLSPELLLAIFGFFVLGTDLVLRDKAPLVRLTLMGLILAFLATVSLWGTDRTFLAAMLTVDPFAVAFKAFGILATILVVLVACDYVPVGQRGQQTDNPATAIGTIDAPIAHQGEFYSLLLFAAMSITLLASATSLIMIYLSIEFLSITSYILVGYLRRDTLSNEAALKYFFYGAITAAVMLYGISLLYGLTGAVDLRGIAGYLATITPEPGVLRWAVLPAAVMVVAGFGFKVSAVPFHQWAPDAYEGAPTPITAFISVAPKVAGFAVMLRVLVTALPYFRADWVGLIAAMSAVSMTLGNVVAIPQTNIKRMLAYSSIAQAGYILIGVAAASTLGVTATLFYVLIYALSNLGAFATVIVVSNHLNSDAIPDYAGLSQRSPGLALAMLLFLLSLAGIPPLAGFIGKFYLFSAAVEQGMVWLVVIGVINSVVSLYYYLIVVKAMYIAEPPTEEPVPVSRALSAALLITALGVLLLGIFPRPFLAWIQTAAQVFLPG